MTDRNDLPSPLVPADVDLRDFPFMPLHVAQLLDSETWLLATGDEAKAAVTLWCKAWHQKPAASLPNDDRVLAALSGAGSKWKRVKAVALRGFTLCSDGRLYHPVIAEEALNSWGKKDERKASDGNKAERQRRWRERLKQASERLREMGETPPPGASMETLERLIVDAEKRLQRRPVDKTETGKTETGTETGTIDDADDGAQVRDPIREALDSIGAWDNPNLHIHGARVLDWIRQGADLDLDIIPTLQSVLAKARKSRGDPAFMPTSLNFFEQAIADALAARTRPLPNATTGGADYAPAAKHQSSRRHPDHRNGFCALIAERAGGGTGEGSDQNDPGRDTRRRDVAEGGAIDLDRSEWCDA